MDHVFDRLTRVRSRRALASALGLATIAVPGLSGARKNHKHKNRHRKKKIKRNAFGCVDVGSFCKNDDQCCSGICQGKKCTAHDTGGCQEGDQETACGGASDLICTADNGSAGVCNTTTGNAGYCVVDAGCFPCTKDAECRQFCGAAAACIRCEPFCSEQGGTACAGLLDACQGLPD